jgi:hypothetical protein
MRDRVTNCHDSRTVLGKQTREGESPVNEIIDNSSEYPKYHETRVILWESGETTLQG